MIEAAQAPTYTINFLGSTDLYDVYDVVIYPALLSDRAAQTRYKQHVQNNLTRAQQHRRSIWGAVDLSRLSLPQLIVLAYRLTLPFIRQPMIFKVYGVGVLPEQDESTKMLDWLMRHTFRMAVVANRAAALPPRFVADDPAAGS